MVVKDYKWSLLVVVACTFITPVATLSSTLFTKTLIDDYIIPLTQATSPDYTPLAMAIGKLAVILTFGALCAYLQSRLMINVSQGTLLRLRRDTFSHMQQLPINYFDQHSHGDIMSVYTNDIDTLRQMISSLPNIFSSVVTITITFASMIVLSWPLTLLTIIMSIVMIYTTRKLGNISASHFRQQQESLGQLNGFVEEMLTGQKVVKTFCHEERAIQRFNQLNEQLRDNACNANRVANIVMPVNGNLSNLIYVMAAIFGAMLALKLTTDSSFFTLHLPSERSSASSRSSRTSPAPSAKSPTRLTASSTPWLEPTACSTSSTQPKRKTTTMPTSISSAQKSATENSLKAMRRPTSGHGKTARGTSYVRKARSISSTSTSGIRRHSTARSRHPSKCSSTSRSTPTPGRR